MAKSRAKKVLITEEITKEQAEIIFGEYASFDAQINQVTSKMDMEITRVREKYQEKLNTLCEAREKSMEKLQHFAVNNPDHFTKKRSLEFTHGVLGFRTGNPTLKTLRGFTWPAVTNMLKTFLPDYVRTVEEPAKDKLLADRDKEEIADLFEKVGIEVKQQETFYVEPKKEQAAVLA